MQVIRRRSQVNPCGSQLLVVPTMLCSDLETATPIISSQYLIDHDACINDLTAANSGVNRLAIRCLQIGAHIPDDIGHRA